MKDVNLLTVKGMKMLQSELKYLKSTVRTGIIQQIAEARSHGDLKENAEYHAAREKQRFNELRINTIERTLSNVSIIDSEKTTNKDIVGFGAKVSVIREKNNKLISYQIVGEEEADPKNNMVSFTSPISRALLGKKIKEKAYINTPGGVELYCIESIDYTAD